MELYDARVESPAPTATTMMHVNLKFIDEVAIATTVDRGIRIDALKTHISQVKGTAVSSQRLIYKGKVLRDNMHLHDYNFKDGDTVHVVVTPPRATTSTSTTSQLPTSPYSPPSGNNTTEDAQHEPTFAVVPAASHEALTMEVTPAPMTTVVWPRPGTRRMNRHRIDELVAQASQLRQAAERLSAATTSLAHSPLASTLSDFSNALLVLARQVSSVAQAIEAGVARDVAADAAMQRAVSDAMDLLRQLEAVAPSVRDVLSAALAPPEEETTITFVHFVPSASNEGGSASGMGLMMTIMQALGSAVRGPTEPRPSIAITSGADAAITATQDPESSPVAHPQPQPRPPAPFTDARAPLVGVETPLSALLDMVFAHMQSFFSSGNSDAQPLHAMPTECLATLHVPLRRVLRTALGFADDVAPPQLPKRTKVWARAAARQVQAWLSEATTGARHTRLRREAAYDGSMLIPLFQALVDVVLTTSSSAQFATDIRRWGVRCVSMLLHTLVVGLDTADEPVSSLEGGLAMAVVERIACTLVNVARDRDVLDDAGLRVVRHVILSATRECLDAQAQLVAAVVQPHA